MDAKAYQSKIVNEFLNSKVFFWPDLNLKFLTNLTNLCL